MKWLTNTYDPKKPEAKMYLVIPIEETRDQAWKNHLKYLEGKHIGNPKATEKHTVSELLDANLVGVYSVD